MRDENLIDTFRRLLAICIGALVLPRVILPSVSARQATYAYVCLCVYTVYIICRAYMHDSCIYAKASVAVQHVRISPISLRGRRQLTNCQTSYESLFKRSRRESRTVDRMKGRRGGTCAIEYPTNLASRADQISLTLRAKQYARTSFESTRGKWD